MPQDRPLVAQRVVPLGRAVAGVELGRGSVTVSAVGRHPKGPKLMGVWFSREDLPLPVRDVGVRADNADTRLPVETVRLTDMVNVDTGRGLNVQPDRETVVISHNLQAGPDLLAYRGPLTGVAEVVVRRQDHVRPPRVIDVGAVHTVFVRPVRGPDNGVLHALPAGLEETHSVLVF